MKASMPGTDQKAEFNIFVNGYETPLEEFEIKFGALEANIIECYVPVNISDEIIVRGSFEGTVLYGAFDLVCDGSFAADSRIDSKDQEPAFRKRTFEYRKVIHNTKPDDWRSISWPTDAAEGKLLVKTLDAEVMKQRSNYEIYDAAETILGVGSIEVVISINQETRDHYFCKEWGCSIGHWKERGVRTVRDPGILPDHELGIDVTEPIISRKRALKFKRHWEGTRFSPSPWARFIFYYRGMDTIMEAGALPVYDEKLLNPRGTHSYLGRAERYLSKAKQDSLEPAEQSGIQGSPVVATSSRQTTSSPVKGIGSGYVSPSRSKSSQAKTFTKRLGGNLVLSKKEPAADEFSTPSTKECKTQEIVPSFTDPMNAYRTDSEKPQHTAVRSRVDSESAPRPLHGHTESHEGNGTAIAAHCSSVNEDPPFSLTEDDWMRDGGIDDENWASIIPMDMMGADNWNNHTDACKSASPIRRMNSPVNQKGEIWPQTQAPDFGHEKYDLEDFQLGSENHLHESATSDANKLQQTTLNAGVDFDRLPSPRTIRTCIPPDGIDRWSLHLILDRNGPYQNLAEAQAEFDRRLSEVAEENPADNRFYTKPMSPNDESLVGKKPLVAYGAGAITRSTDDSFDLVSELFEQGPRLIMDGDGKPDKTLLPFTGARKRGAPTSDTSSQPVSQRQRISPAAKPIEKAHVSEVSKVQDDDEASPIAIKLAEAQRLLEEKRRRKMERDAKIAKAKRRKDEKERFAREEKEREDREVLERLQEQMRLLDEDEEHGEEELRQLQDEDDSYSLEDHNEEGTQLDGFSYDTKDLEH